MSVRFEIDRYCGSWRWTLFHQNGCVVAHSELYSRKSDVKRAIARLKKVKLSKADVTESGS
jgi:uncharacterized protein YegP (UPF0339 family)